MKRDDTRVHPQPTLESLPEILDATDLSTYLGMPCSTVRTLAKEGRIPSFKIGRRRKFRREAIRQWLDELSSASSAPTQPPPPPQQPLHNARARPTPRQHAGSSKRRKR